MPGWQDEAVCRQKVMTGSDDREKGVCGDRGGALPGNVGNANSELTNLLIKNGAKLCVAADDIIRDLI